MNYLSISIKNDQLIAALGSEQWIFSSDFTDENLTAICNELGDQPVDGAVLEWEEEVLTHAGCTNSTDIVEAEDVENVAAFLAFQQVDKFRLALEERLNLPVIFKSAVHGSAEEAVEAALLEEQARCSWQLVYHDFRTGKDEYAAESLLTTGNGFIGLRGTAPEMSISEDAYPATYLAGLYNTAESLVEGQVIKNEDFVNAPNLQYLSLEIDGEVLEYSQRTVKFFKRSLDLKTGLFEATSIVETATGKQLRIVTKRVVSMAEMHQYSLSYEVTPLNFSGQVLLITEADGTVFNYNVARYRSLTNQHLKVCETAAEGTLSRLVAKTLDSDMTIVQEAQLFSPNMDLSKMKAECTDEKVRQTLAIDVAAGQPYEVQKSVSVHLYGTNEARAAHDFGNVNIADFTAIYSASREVWQQYWEETAITIKGDMMSEKMLNLHTYHMLVSGSPTANPSLDASITARGLHGEAYRGHIFWDELFILPFYIIHFPETARQLLMYRYNRLAAAKASAAQAGYQGAMFPWQSGLDGSEQSQELHLNPISGEWGEDHSRLQRHVSLAIAYNVWLYNNNTEDRDFMVHYGIELLMEIAKFWLSITEWNEEVNRYSISGVMGPDEFHEAYPGSEKGGLTDNAYTNMMVVWLFEEIEDLYLNYSADDLAAAQQKASISRDDLVLMNQIRHDLRLEIDPDGVIAQHAGYFDLKEVDWAYYKEKYGNIYRMDRILSAEGRSADEYKVAKQADSLMIFYNFGKDKVDQILADLGYQLPKDYLEKNLQYYLARTSHGSTLSRIVHSQLASIVDDNELAWALYQQALYSDYQDIQGGTTAEGIHAGVMAATLFITLTTFAGIDIRQKEVTLRPHLPEKWKNLAFRLTIRGIHYHVWMDKEKVQIKADQTTTVTIGSEEIPLEKGKMQEVFYEGAGVS